MGAMFRSEEMALAQLFVQPEAAYLTVSELGEAGIVQFRDLNEDVNAFQRKFVSEVKRCDEMERKLRYIEAEVKKESYIIHDALNLPRAPNPREIIDLEAHVEKTESDIRELTENAINLKKNYLELTQFLVALEKCNVFFHGQTQEQVDYHFEGGDGGQLSFVLGVVNRERLPAFERMLWRISKGNVFMRQADIDKPLEDPATGNLMQKTVFLCFFQGESLHIRVKKVCEGFRADLYSCPDSPQERHKMLEKLKARLQDLNLVLNQTEDHRRRVLLGVAKEIQNWIIMVKKMKAIYHTLNLLNLDVSKKCLIGECWVPVSDLEMVKRILSQGSETSGSTIPSFMNVIRSNEESPTFNRTNKFTEGFQNLIDAYGVANYREANPALYTIITFPFLFAVMFGDLGHGAILFLFGLFLILKEKTYKVGLSEVYDIFFTGRYIILLMGIFSMYTGFIYNDVFSKSMNIFGSSWKIRYTWQEVEGHESLQLNPSNEDYTQEPYPFGVDPAWQLASNKIIFLNTYKMKLSIIFGVVHMIFGVFMSVVNYAHFRKYSSIFLEFLPQLIFLVVLFLWLVVMMFLKWVIYDPASTELRFQPHCAPSVLIYFIDMMMFTKIHDEGDCEAYMFAFQYELQMALVFVGLACIPIMLFGKPLWIKMNMKKVPKTDSNGDVAGHSKAGHGGHGDEDSMGEILIYQSIHTIEYVLSTVSHTASYLRLWALSLAHAQLSEVLWNMVLQKGLAIFDNYAGAGMLFVVFAFWALFTVSILVMMEGLSAFLHTLRLHWVEFMSKFYSGTGYMFMPFSLKKIISEEEIE